MRTVLDAVLDDLAVGLARRAARRRRARAAGAALVSSLALAAAGVSTAGLVAQPAPATASDGTMAARLIADGRCADLACWDPGAHPRLNDQRTAAAK